MLEQFSNLLKERYRLKEKTKLILAVSGGLDSVVICDLVHNVGYDFAIAHVNFQLRGEDSDADENFVRELSKRYEVPFYSIRDNADEKAKEWKVSIQMSARKIRYDYFEHLLEKFTYDFVFTAHHLDDSFETSLLNFIKSGTYSAIAGIPAINNKVIRPLVSFSRSEIHNYAKANNLIWREDKSNTSLKYQRNIVRHKIVPEIKEINPSFLKTFSEASDQLHLLKFFVKSKLAMAKGKWIIQNKDTIRIDISHLKSNPEDFLLLWELLKEMNFNFQQFQNIVKSIDSESGKKFLSDDFICIKDREHFVITLRNIETEEFVITDLDENIKIDNAIFSARRIVNGINIENDGHIALLDSEKINLPLKLRTWRDGDKFRPLGMKGEKKLSDFLIDLKTPLNQKRKQYVLLSNEEIIWVVGHRINHNYRITENTKQAIRFEVK